MDDSRDPDASDRAACGVTVLVCASCRDETGSDAHPRAGHLLGEATRDAAVGTAVKVRQVECLGNCKRRLSAAMLRVAEYKAFTDTGRARRHNEDAMFARSPVFAVATSCPRSAPGASAPASAFNSPTNSPSPRTAMSDSRPSAVVATILTRRSRLIATSLRPRDR